MVYLLDTNILVHWIATSTYILGGILLTTDNDFEHLDGLFFQVQKLKI